MTNDKSEFSPEQSAEVRRTSEEYVREVLRRREFEFRWIAISALAGMKSLGISATVWIPKIPQLFSAIASLQRPSWGHWNGLLSGLRRFNEVYRKEDAAAADEATRADYRLFESLRPSESLRSALEELSKAAGTKLPQRLKRRDACLVLIGLRNCIAHDVPADPDWWNRVASALVIFEREFLSFTPDRLPSPWMFSDGEELWSFTGVGDDFSPKYASLRGQVRVLPERAGEFIEEFRQLLGHSETADQEFRGLLTRLAPEELKGVLLGDYLLGSPVGRGGFAQVHMGRQLSTGRKVALKILHQGMGEVDQARFREEAAHLARFVHPGIVQVVDHGDSIWKPLREFDLSAEPWFQELKAGPVVRTWIALEWVEGKTLNDFVNAADRPSVEVIAEWFAQAAEALAAVHQDGLLHRDLTPGNLMVTVDGLIKLMDFGIARNLAEADQLRTVSGAVVGTPAYMSPEQLEFTNAARSVSTQSDVYALCATFYEVFTGRRLYDHDSSEAGTVITNKLNGIRPVSPASLNANLPWQVENLLMGGLEREPEDRAASAVVLAADLRRAQRNEPTVYRRPSFGRRMLLWYRRNRTVVSVSLGFLIVLGVLGGFAQSIISSAEVRNSELSEENKEELRRRLAAEQQKVAAEQQKEVQKQLADTSERKRVFEEYASDMRTVMTHWETGRIDLLRGVLAKYERPGITDPRSFEWYYWRQRADGQSRNLTSPASAFRSVSVAGKRIFTIDLEGIVCAWDLETLELVYRLDETAYSFTVSPDGEWLATSDTNTVYLHRGPTGDQRRALGTAILADAMAFSADGSQLLVGDAGANLLLWSVPDGEFKVNLSDNKQSQRMPEIDPRLSLDKQAGPLRSVAFSPDGMLAASGCDDGTIKVWDVATGRYVGPNRIVDANAVVLHNGPVSSLMFSADGKMVVSGSVGVVDEFDTSQTPGEIRIWDVESGEVLHVLQPFSDAVPFLHGGPPSDYRVVFSPDQTQIFGCSEAGISIWDVRTGALVDVLRGAEGRFISLAVDGQQSIMGIGEDRTLRIWDESTRSHVLSFLENQVDLRAIRLSPDGTQLGAVCEMTRGNGSEQSDDRVHRIWDLATGQQIPSTQRPAWIPPHGLRQVFSPEGSWTAVIGYDKTVTVTTTDSQETRTLSLASTDADPSRRPDKHDAEAGAESVKAPWEYAEESSDPMLEAVPISAVSQDGNWLAVWSIERGVTLWNIAEGTGQFIDRFAGKPRALEFRNDSKALAVGDAAGTVHVLDMETGETLHEYRGHSREISGIAFSSDGRRMAVSTGSPVIHSNREGEVRLWDLDTHSYVLTLGRGDGHVFHSAVFSPDGSSLYAAAATIEPPAPNVRPRSRVLVWSGGSGVSADARTKPEGGEAEADMKTVQFSGKPISDIQFHPRRPEIAVLTSDGTVHVTSLPSGEILQGWSTVEDLQAILAYSPAGGRLISLNRGIHDKAQVKIIDPSQKECSTLQVEGDDSDVVSAGFAGPKGNAAALVRENQIMSLQLDDGTRIDLKLTKADFDVIRNGHAIFSDDGKRVLCGGRIYRKQDLHTAPLFVLNATSGEKERELGELVGAVTHIDVSPDGTVVAFSENETETSQSCTRRISLWNLESGRMVDSLDIYEEELQVTGISVSNQGEQLAVILNSEGTEDYEVRLYDRSTSPPTARSLPQHPRPVQSVALSADGAMIASGDQRGVLRIWKTAAEKWAEPDLSSVTKGSLHPRRRESVLVEQFSGTVRSIEFSSDGTRLVTVDDQQLRVLNSQSGRLKQSMEINDLTDGFGLKVNQHAEQLWLINKGDVREWQAEGGFTSDAGNSKNRVLDRTVPGSDQSFLIAEADEREQFQIIRVQGDKTDQLYARTSVPEVAVLSSNGDFAALCTSSEILVISTSDGKRRFRYRVNSTATHPTFSPDGMTFAAVVVETVEASRTIPFIKVWDLESGRILRSTRIPFPPLRSVNDLAVTDNGTWVVIAAGPAAVAGDRPSVFAGATDGKWRIAPVPFSEATCLALNPDGTQLAAGSLGQVTLLQFNPGRWPEATRPGRQRSTK
ncbi:MAG: protein kinase [Planctomyces sp.]|nr:protein kinase [Planctomyces sp.]